MKKLGSISVYTFDQLPANLNEGVVHAWIPNSHPDRMYVSEKLYKALGELPRKAEMWPLSFDHLLKTGTPEDPIVTINTNKKFREDFEELAFGMKSERKQRWFFEHPLCTKGYQFKRKEARRQVYPDRNICDLFNFAWWMKPGDKSHWLKFVCWARISPDYDYSFNRNCDPAKPKHWKDEPDARVLSMFEDLRKFSNIPVLFPKDHIKKDISFLDLMKYGDQNNVQVIIEKDPKRWASHFFCGRFLKKSMSNVKTMIDRFEHDHMDECYDLLTGAPQYEKGFDHRVSIGPVSNPKNWWNGYNLVPSYNISLHYRGLSLRDTIQQPDPGHTQSCGVENDHHDPSVCYDTNCPSLPYYRIYGICCKAKLE